MSKIEAAKMLVKALDREERILSWEANRLLEALNQVDKVLEQAQAWVAVGEDGYRTNPSVYCGEVILRMLDEKVD